MAARPFVFRALVLTACCGLLAAVRADDKPADPKDVEKKIIEVAGKAEFLRNVPKRFATLQAIDLKNNRVTLLLEGDKDAKEWAVNPDAELKVSGWWGRLEDFTPGDRVWVWFQTNRKKAPTAVAMLADEVSEQDIHGAGPTLVKADKDTLTIKPTKGADRTLATKQALEKLEVGKPAYVQTAADKARLVLSADEFEKRRADQKAALRKRWIDEGLPGSVTFLHRFSGEMELMLDHEAMRWGRSLQTGDDVTLQADPPIRGVVKTVRPWRERTELRLVVNGFDQSDLSLGQRVRMKIKTPKDEVDTAPFPPDLDRPRTKEERVEWFLCNIYCTCKVPNDTCTGDFYTLASCNPNGCGMPNAMRKKVGGLIDKGLTDLQIFETLLKDQGPDLLRPHLLP